MKTTTNKLFPNFATKAEKESIAKAIVRYIDDQESSQIAGKEDWVMLIVPEKYDKQFTSKQQALNYAEKNNIDNPVIINVYRPSDYDRPRSIEDTAKQLGVSKTRVYALIKSGKLLRKNDGVDRFSILTYLSSRKVGRPILPYQESRFERLPIVYEMPKE